MSTEQTLSFIEDYKSLKILWDIHCKEYNDKNKRNKAYSDLANKHKMTVAGVKNKIKSLRSYFCKEYHKMKERQNEAGDDYIYESPWFAYNSLKFILDFITPKPSKDIVASKCNNDDNVTTYKLEDDFTEESEGSNLDTDKDYYISICKDDSISKNETEETIEFQRKNSMQISGNNCLVDSQKKTKRKYDNYDELNDENEEEDQQSFKIPAIESISTADELTIFGQYIASQIKKFNKRNQAIAKNRIQNIIFELEIGELDRNT